MSPGRPASLMRAAHCFLIYGTVSGLPSLKRMRGALGAGGSREASLYALYACTGHTAGSVFRDMRIDVVSADDWRVFVHLILISRPDFVRVSSAAVR